MGARAAASRPKGLLAKIIALLFPPKTAPKRVRAALRRHEARVDAMTDEWAQLRAACCPGCMFGMRFTEATEQCIRTGRWLRVLLRKRGSVHDLEELSQLDTEYPESF